MQTEVLWLVDPEVSSDWPGTWASGLRSGKLGHEHLTRLETACHTLGNKLSKPTASKKRKLGSDSFCHC